MNKVFVLGLLTILAVIFPVLVKADTEITLKVEARPVLYHKPSRVIQTLNGTYIVPEEMSTDLATCKIRAWEGVGKNAKKYSEWQSVAQLGLLTFIGNDNWEGRATSAAAVLYAYRYRGREWRNTSGLSECSSSVVPGMKIPEEYNIAWRQLIASYADGNKKGASCAAKELDGAFLFTTVQKWTYVKRAMELEACI